eukprot:263541-Pelagomonas_calceolata.AAC.3
MAGYTGSYGNNSSQIKEFQVQCSDALKVALSYPEECDRRDGWPPRQCNEREKNYIGRGNSPYMNEGKGHTLAQKSCESPPPQSYKTGNANEDLEGY